MNGVRGAKGWSGLAGAALVLALCGLGGAAPATAQDAVRGTDPGWLAWLGCSEVVDGAEGIAETEPSLVCVRPVDGAPDVELASVEGGRVTAREVLAADGRRRDSGRDGCDGWIRGSFSEDGQRVFLRSEHVCPGGVERISTGLLAWVSPYEWMEVRTVEVRGSPRTWVRRYRAVGPDRIEAVGAGVPTVEPTMAVESARMAAASPPGIDDVVEASSHLPPDGVGAWIAEQGDPFDVDRDALLRMADAGVPGSVIDVAVAVSFPDRFVVDPSGAVEVQAPPPPAGGRYPRTRRPRWGFGIGGWYPGYYRFDPYGYHSPWGYAGWSGYGYRPSRVYVVPRSGSDGRVVNDRGYTRSPESGDRTTRPARRTRPSSGSSPSAAPSSGRGGGSSADAVSPSGGYRNGGASGSDEGRTARPRSGGGSSGNEGGDDGGGR